MADVEQVQRRSKFVLMELPLRHHCQRVARHSRLEPPAGGRQVHAIAAPLKHAHGQPRFQIRDRLVLEVEHPSVATAVTLDIDAQGNVERAGVLRTARKLFDGEVFAD